MRTDIHRPAFIRPEDYSYVGIIYQGRSEEAWAEITDSGRDPEYHAAIKALEEAPFDGNHKHRGTCDHCGSSFAYGAVYHHQPTGEHICVGHICAFETLGSDSRRDLELKRLKQRLEAQKKLQKIRDSAAKWLGEHPELAGLFAQEAKPENSVHRDMHYKLWNVYGSLTDNQVRFAKEIMEERTPEPEVEKPLTPVVSGSKVEIEGEVLSIKSQESIYGWVWKMLVMDDRRFKLWGTVPSSIDPEIGDRVRFVAGVEASRDDVHFGFFKRPRKAEVLA